MFPQFLKFDFYLTNFSVDVFFFPSEYFHDLFGQCYSVQEFFTSLLQTFWDSSHHFFQVKQFLQSTFSPLGIFQVVFFVSVLFSNLTPNPTQIPILSPIQKTQKSMLPKFFKLNFYLPNFSYNFSCEVFYFTFKIFCRYLLTFLNHRNFFQFWNFSHVVFWALQFFSPILTSMVFFLAVFGRFRILVIIFLKRVFFR